MLTYGSTVLPTASDFSAFSDNPLVMNHVRSNEKHVSIVLQFNVGSTQHTVLDEFPVER